MSAQLAEHPAADPAWENITKFPHPRSEPGQNPILDAPLNAPLEPPPNAVLNREPPKAKRQRKAKGTGKKPGRPKKPEPTAEAPTAPPAPPAQQLATPPHGDALPKFNSENVFTLMTIIWLVVGFGSGVGACYLMWGPVL